MPPPPPPINTQNATGSASAPHSAKFTPDEWVETFKDSTWAFDPTKETSPRRAATTNRRSKATTRKPTSNPTNIPIIDLTGDGNAGKAANSKAEAAPKFQAFAEDAMDVDSDGPPAKEPHGSRTGAHASQPALNGTGAEPKPAATVPPPAQEQVASALDGLTNLKNVEPFAPNENGLFGIADLGSSLPFKSQPSTSHPTKPNAAKQLNFPHLPVPPEVPAKLDAKSFDEYMIRMKLYTTAVQRFDDIMLKHFMARKEQMAGLDPNWLRNQGETTKAPGFDTYTRAIEQDEQALEHWMTGKEKHKEAMAKCKDVRRRAARGYGDKLP
jgi:hypothetical protein